MEVSSYGGTRDRVVGPRPDPQGPLGDDRGRGRPDRRGHHRHRPDPELPDPLPARQEPASRSGSARSSTSPPGGSSTSRSTTSGSRSRTSSSSATASTTASTTATCASWASSAPRSTRAPTDDASTTPRCRAPAGRPRRVVIIVVGCFLPWWQTSSRPRPAAALGQRVRRAAACSSSSSPSRSSPCSRCRTRPATSRSALDRPLSFLILARRRLARPWRSALVDLGADEPRRGPARSGPTGCGWRRSG